MLHTFNGTIACDDNCSELPLKHLAVFFCAVICYILRGFLAEWILCLWFLPEALWRRNGPVSENFWNRMPKNVSNKISKTFAMKMTTSFHIPVFSIHQQCVVPQYFLESLAYIIVQCTAVSRPIWLAENGPMTIRKRRLLLVHPGRGNQCQAATSLGLRLRLGRHYKESIRTSPVKFSS